MNKCRLCDINKGDVAEIISVKADGDIIKRFSDIGLIEKTAVECVGQSPLGDPKAYLIRGSVIAIRNKDCKDINAYYLRRGESK